MIPAFLLSFYTPKMFEASLLSEMPVKKTKKKGRKNRGRRDDEPRLGESLHSGQGILNPDNVISLIQEMALVNKVKTGFWETLCHVTRCCGKNRRVRLRKKSAARYQEHLDIRSFVSVETNLTLLLSLLLTRRQLTLFKSN